MPKALRRLIDGLTKSKLDWKTLLDSHIRSSAVGGYTAQGGADLAFRPLRPEAVRISLRDEKG